MAPPPLAALTGVRLAFGGAPLFQDLDLALARGERACLVGRNGSGKSSLLKLLAGEIEPDAGERSLAQGARAAYLPQEPLLPPEMTVADFVAQGLPSEAAEARHTVEATLEKLELSGSARLGALSGGEGRRAALARALVSEPDLLLLDEPTNHLDLPTITWLEEELSRFSGALLLVSHDRAFLARVSNRTLWLDRGRLKRLEQGFAAFDDWAEAERAAEEKALARLGKHIAEEERWRARGVTARRRRNQGRLAKLEALRASRAALLARRPGQLSMSAAEAAEGGRLVIEAEGISKNFPRPDGSRLTVVRDFSTRVRRGDRLGIIGRNGAGKTTLIRLLIGELPPDSGRVKLGTGLRIALFDQRRESLDPEASLWETLCPGGGDSVMAGGRQRHVVSYLADFLFAEAQARQPVKTLSGGERNRLLLARLFAEPSNLLVMDEPTNDLDMDTLDLLEEVLADYGGTLILASHDRDFLDRLATSVILLDGAGGLAEYPGGASDALRQAGGLPAARPTPAKAPKRPGERPSRSPGKLGYKEERELAELPRRIETLAQERRRLEARLAEPDLYRRDPEAFAAASARHEELGRLAAEAEDRWLALEEKRERLERAS